MSGECLCPRQDFSLALSYLATPECIAVVIATVAVTAFLSLLLGGIRIFLLAFVVFTSILLALETFYNDEYVIFIVSVVRIVSMSTSALIELYCMFTHVCRPDWW